MKTDKYIVGIGAANMDVHGRSRAPINLRDSNPGRMHTSVGGVTRNILENYVRLGGRAVLLTVVGDDVFGQKILQESENAGIDVSHVKMVKDSVSSTYMSILNNDGEMAVALSDMRIMENLSVDYLRDNDRIIRGARLIVTDPSIPEAVMDYLLDHYGREIPVFVDPVSVAYAGCIKEKQGRFYRIKPNELECELLSGRTIKTEEDLWEAVKTIVSTGVKEVYVSRGKKGCLYYDSVGTRLTACLKPLEDAVNVTGAGDAFMAAIIYGKVCGMEKQDILNHACRAGLAAIMSADTINKEINIELLNKILEERL